MKTIKINNIEVSAEELRRVIKENPDILKDEVKGRYFFPKNGDSYWSVESKINHFISDNFVSDDFKFNNRPDYINSNITLMCNCYRTEEEARLALAKQKAIVACWKWAQENAPFEPDWDDGEQERWSVFYHTQNYTKNKYLEICCSSYAHDNITLPYFKSKEDAEAFINANKDNLMLLFTK